MSVRIPARILAEIHAHGEAAYPDEGAGFMLGSVDGEDRVAIMIMAGKNVREDVARGTRYEITPLQTWEAEQLAEKRGLQVFGIFHSHPDHLNQPSEFDREHALPWYSYLITTVEKGKAIGTRSWRLSDDRSKYTEEEIEIIEEKK